MKLIKFINPQYFPLRMFSSQMTELSQIRSWLNGFHGGDVKLSLQPNDDIAYISLCNSKHKNALTGHMMVRLDEVVRELENSPPKGLIIYGEGGTFCSGGNLKFVSQIMTSEYGKRMCLFMQDVTTRLRNLPCVSVALTNGAVVGGGMEVAMTFDYRVSTSKCIFSLRQARLGVSCGWGGGVSIVKRLGPQTALRLLLSTEDLDPTAAKSVGIVDHILDTADDETALKECTTWLTDLVKPHPKKLVHVLKQLVKNGSESGDLRKECELFTQVWGDEFHVQSVEKILKSLNAK